MHTKSHARGGKPSSRLHLLVLGAGPAGLACSHELDRRGYQTTLIERNPTVGGLARTIEYKGYRFDLGPHRFYTKNQEVNKFWHEILGHEVLHIKRLTRILYDGQLFHYPLKPLDTLWKLGFWSCTIAILSFLHAKWRFAGRPATNFEEWVVKEFGWRLFNIFFKTYTEKVWGIPCSQIGAEWAAQRIKGLSLGQAIRHALFRPRQKFVKSLVDEFDYPRLGAGQVYEILAALLQEHGHTLNLNHTVSKIRLRENRIIRVTTQDSSGTETDHAVDFLFSSIPITALIFSLEPVPPPQIIEAARRLYYRDHITVNLIMNRPSVFPDHWIYIHSPEVRMARVSEYGNFSKDMLADPNCSAVSVEYFCFAHEDLWSSSDQDLLRLAADEVEKVGLVQKSDITDGFVVREKDSYPTYYVGHRPHFEAVKEYAQSIKNLSLIGRGGMYKYNNQDHAILSGILAARFFDGEDVDPWNVNIDEAYLEEKPIE